MGFRSIKEIFIIGHGPSSSHTMGPYFACEYILKKYKDYNIKNINVTLYGSLALTGKGHLTDEIIHLGLRNYEHNIIFDNKSKKKHPNTIIFKIITDQKTFTEEVISVGGGSIITNNEKKVAGKEIYKETNLSEIIKYCQDKNISFYDYIIEHEDEDITSYFKDVLKAMDEAVERGLKAEGYLPGSLKIKRKAKKMYEAMGEVSLGINDVPMNVAIRAMAVAEENASGGVVVTAPTCGSAGVIPGCIQYLRMKHVDEETIIKGLMVAGLFGIVCKTNASVSGAEAGCQAEIGVACSMAAAMISYCFKKDIDDIVQGAEIALEHSLGLTCDPVDGYVQIPCIERCAIYAVKAIDAVKLAIVIPNDDIHVTYDDSVRTMYKTGLDMNKNYKETSKGGLAFFLGKKNK